MYRLTSPVRRLSTSKSGNPCERFMAPQSAAMRDMTVKIVVPTSGSFERKFIGAAGTAESNLRSHFVFDPVFGIDLSPGNIGKFALQQALFQRRQVVDEQLAFDVIVFVLDDPGFDTVILLIMEVPVFIIIPDAQLFLSGNGLTYVGNAETALLKFPVVALLFQ